MDNFLSEKELDGLGIKKRGKDVRIGRHAVLYSPGQLTLGNHVRIDDFTVISGKVSLGNYIHISQFCGLYGGDAGIVMEDYSGLSSKCSVYAVSDDYSGSSMTNPTVPMKYKLQSISAPVKIGRHAIIGCGSVVLPGVEVGEGTSVGSMSLCNKNTGKWSVYAGAPARQINKRKQDLLELEKQLTRDEAQDCFYIGQEKEEEKVFTADDVALFSQISGDKNPLHLDEAYAKKGRFGAAIVHGILVSGLISKIIATELPGEGSIYLEQNLQFLKPVYVGEKVCARVKIADIVKNVYTLETSVYNSSGICVLCGKAKVLYEG